MNLASNLRIVQTYIRSQNYNHEHFTYNVDELGTEDHFISAVVEDVDVYERPAYLVLVLQDFRQDQLFVFLLVVFLVDVLKLLVCDSLVQQHCIQDAASIYQHVGYDVCADNSLRHVHCTLAFLLGHAHRRGRCRPVYVSL